MKIEIDINVNDCLALNDHLIKTSPLMKGEVRKGQLWWAGGPIFGAALLPIIKDMSFGEAVVIISLVTLILSVSGFLLYPMYFKRCNRKFVKKCCESEKKKGILGKHTITVTNDTFKEKTEYNDTSIPWNAIDRVETTQDYTFIFTNETVAYIVPCRSLDSETYKNFVNEVKRFFNRDKE